MWNWDITRILRNTAITSSRQLLVVPIVLSAWHAACGHRSETCAKNHTTDLPGHQHPLPVLWLHVLFPPFFDSFSNVAQLNDHVLRLLLLQP